MATMTQKFKIFYIFISQSIREIAATSVQMVNFKSVSRTATFTRTSRQNFTVSFSCADRSFRRLFSFERFTNRPNWRFSQVKHSNDSAVVEMAQKRNVSDRHSLRVKAGNIFALFLDNKFDSCFTTAKIRTSYRGLKSIFGDVVFFIAVRASEGFTIFFHRLIIPERRPKCSI